MTEKLYDISSKIKDFECTVLRCELSDGEYLIETDRTAFFPESAGQCGDTGTIGDAVITDTRYDGERIVHISRSPLEAGKSYRASLDFAPRYRRMQNHTGEHIVSSIMHRRFGFSNVGFHLGSKEMTFDFDGVITPEQMKEVEDEANRISAENVAIKTYYPSEKELEALDYRSKGELEGRVRIVEIEGIDLCACCAPHVERTGEVGMIKILGFIHYKGGIRIRMKCGFDALDDFRDRISREEQISRLLCVPQEESADAVTALSSALSQAKREFSEAKKRLAEAIAAGIDSPDKNVCIVVDGFATDDLRYLCNLCAGKCRVFAALSETDGGFSVVCASKTVPLRQYAKIICEKGKGKCGGSDLMLTGRLTADKETIIRLFEEEII